MSLFFTQYKCHGCEHEWVGQSGIVGMQSMGEAFSRCPQCQSKDIAGEPYVFETPAHLTLRNSMPAHYGAKSYIDAMRESSTNKVQAQVHEFHVACGVPAYTTPRLIPEDRQKLRERLIREEFEELLTAMAAGDIVGIADALADLTYVVYGTAVEHGINLDPISDEVHRSNMSKLENGKAIHRADGKVLKGPNYTPPDLAPIIERLSK